MTTHRPIDPEAYDPERADAYERTRIARVILDSIVCDLELVERKLSLVEDVARELGLVEDLARAERTRIPVLAALAREADAADEEPPGAPDTTTVGPDENGGPPPMNLYISSAKTPYGNEYGVIAVVADSRNEAIIKARAALSASESNYVPAERYRGNLLEHLDSGMTLVEEGVFIDWKPAEKR